VLTVRRSLYHGVDPEDHHGDWADSIGTRVSCNAQSPAVIAWANDLLFTAITAAIQPKNTQRYSPYAPFRRTAKRLRPVCQPRFPWIYRSRPSSAQSSQVLALCSRRSPYGRYNGVYGRERLSERARTGSRIVMARCRRTMLGTHSVCSRRGLDLWTSESNGGSSPNGSRVVAPAHRCQDVLNGAASLQHYT
jgi:hypothetical protein